MILSPDNVTILVGDVRAVLATLPDRSVQTVVTSPPYWGLRDYGTGKWEGGDPNCSHRVGGQVQDTKWPGAITTGQRPGVDASTCKDCGATRADAQLGLERTPEEYVVNMVGVFREVRRVLRDDGTLWLNLGDSYSGSGDGGGGNRKGNEHGQHDVMRGQRPKQTGCKPKDLIGIPWAVAFALRADGWYLRSDIIWAKPNAMPESVTDRPTKAHEYLFLLTKSERYYYDDVAIREKSSWVDEDGRPLDSWGRPIVGKQFGNGLDDRRDDTRRVPRKMGANVTDGQRNARSVWTIATQPYSGAHFATFPEELARRCILAGSKPGDTCLDPFGGSGTTAAVAWPLGRKAIYVDLNPEYADLARIRIAKGPRPGKSRTAKSRHRSQPTLFPDG